MTSRRILRLLGVVLMVAGGTRLSMQLGLSGLSNAFWAIFAIGIILVARDPVRELSERVHALEAQLARHSGESGSASPTAV